MNITDINDDTILIGKMSITVKDSNGKTRGVVTNCKTAATFSPCDKIELAKKGISLEDTKNCVLHDGNVYFLNNKRLAIWLEKYEKPEHPEYFATERTKVEKQRATAEKMKQNGITVIDCIF